MDTSSLLGGLDRFSKRKDVESTLADIAESTASLNESLSYTTNEYDGHVIFSHAPGEPVALPLATVDAYETDRFRHAFRDEHIAGRRLLLKGTTLGKALANPSEAQYGVSAIETEMPQMVYTERLIHEDAVVGAVQYSFTPVEKGGYLENIPDEDIVARLTHQARKDLGHLAARIAHLQSTGKEYGPLGLAMEYDTPVAPNAYVVRWDIKDSTTMVRNNYKALDAFANHAHIFLHRLGEDYQKRYRTDQFGIEKVYDNQGDGAYIILPLPSSHNPYDTQVLSDYHTYDAAPFLNDARAGLEAISAQYFPDIRPSVLVSGDFGYVEENGIQRLKSKTMYELSGQKKSRP